MSEAAETMPVRPAHRLDVAGLERHLARHVPGFAGPLAVRQFRGGQSNPSFLLEAGALRLVLRKQPPGKLLPSAHRVDREYRVLSALRATDVPVPRTHLLCEDPSVIGTPFYVMDYVEGRILRDPLLPDLARHERAAVFDAMVDVLARLHRVDVAAVGLAEFGKPGNYFSRQIARWAQQYELSKTQEIPAMARLAEWLPRHVPEDDEVTLVHGDYRLENLILYPDEPRVLAVLDWELSTLGHPLADLAYNCLFDVLGGRQGEATPVPGTPSEREYVAAYAARTDRDPGRHWNFCVAFSAFRLAAISQGVYARALQGNAASETARESGRHVALLAERAWGFAMR